MDQFDVHTSGSVQLNMVGPQIFGAGRKVTMVDIETLKKLRPFSSQLSFFHGSCEISGISCRQQISIEGLCYQAVLR